MVEVSGHEGSVTVLTRGMVEVPGYKGNVTVLTRVMVVNHLVQQGARVTVALYLHKSPACKPRSNKILLSLSCLGNLGTHHPRITHNIYGCLIVHPYL